MRLGMMMVRKQLETNLLEVLLFPAPAMAVLDLIFKVRVYFGIA
jgi:hypothetical protein